MINLILPLLLLVLQPVVILSKPRVCNLDVEPGKCRDKINRWYYNTHEKRCLSFVYSGCGGNANSFATKLQCEGSCGDICKQKVDPGRCRAAFRRFAYNHRTGTCEQFTYGGCGGNKNNFQSLKECSSVCKNQCTLPSKTGPCRANMRRYFYNTKTGTCKSFTYGGCRGNANNFKTKSECKKTCSV